MSDNKERIYLQLLVVRYQRGDRSALKEIVAQWERPLFFYIRRLVETEEDAWDVLQVVWMNVMKGLPSVRDTQAVFAWLFKVARNTAISYRRRNPCFEPLSDCEETRENSLEPIELRIGSDDIADLHRAIESLPLPQRDAITLHFLEDFSLEEIAEITQTSVGTVKSRIYYAKLALKNALVSQIQKGERHA